MAKRDLEAGDSYVSFIRMTAKKRRKKLQKIPGKKSKTAVLEKKERQGVEEI